LLEHPGQAILVRGLSMDEIIAAAYEEKI
jgi:hypothetical protein